MTLARLPNAWGLAATGKIGSTKLGVMLAASVKEEKSPREGCLDLERMIEGEEEVWHARYQPCRLSPWPHGYLLPDNNNNNNRV